MKAILEPGEYEGKEDEEHWVKPSFLAFTREPQKKVYTSVVEDVESETLIEIIQRKIPTTSIVYTDGFRSYIPLFQHGYKRHETVNHGANEFVRKGVHVNGIEGFGVSLKHG